MSIIKKGDIARIEIYKFAFKCESCGHVQSDNLYSNQSDPNEIVKLEFKCQNCQSGTMKFYEEIQEPKIEDK